MYSPITYTSTLKKLLLFGILILMFIKCKEDEKPILYGNVRATVMDSFGKTLDSVQFKITDPNGNTTSAEVMNGVMSIKREYGTYKASVSRKWYITSEIEITIDTVTTDVLVPLQAASSYLKVIESTTNSSYPSGSKIVRIQSNGSWRVTSDSQWLSTSVNSGKGTDDLIIYWQESTAVAERVGKVTISNGETNYTITVNQSAPPAIIKVYGKIGNYQSNVPDSVIVEFNTEIVLKSITRKNTNCISDLITKVSGKKLSFTYSCAYLGREYGFSISVTDKSNNLKTFDVNVPFYTSKHQFTGRIKDYKLTPDNQFIWAVTESPNQFLKIATNDMSVVKSFPLPVNPLSFSFNPYSGLINFFSWSKHCYTCGGDVLYSFNPDNGQITTLKMTPIAGYDHTSYPYLFPVSLSMFSNGLGVLISQDDSYNSASRYIDASKNNITYLKDDAIKRKEFGATYMNRDQTLMYLVGRHTDIDVMSPSGEIRTFKSPNPEPVLYFITPNKVDNRVYVAQLYHQFISDMNSSNTALSYFDIRGSYSSGDFSYRKGEENIVYLSVEDLFQILDYGNSMTLLSADIDPIMSKINATIDGKVIIGVRNSSSGQTFEFYKFDIDELSANALPSPSKTGRQSSVSSWSITR